MGVVLGLAGCSQAVGAPTTPDVCWRMFEVAERPPGFRAISRDIPNLETCAARLEATRMMEGGPVTGAYNGHFIFATEAEISSASRLDGFRFPVFEPQDRRAIQGGLQKLIEHETAQATPS